MPFQENTLSGSLKRSNSNAMSFDGLAINSVEIYKADIPLRKAELLSVGEFSETNNLIIKINTNTNNGI